MMLQVLSDQIFRDVASTPCAIADGPEVLPPVPFPQVRKFLLEHARRTPFQAFHDVADRFRRRIFDEHMHMILTDYALEDANIFRITAVRQQGTTAFLDLAFQPLVPVFRYPHTVDCQARNGMIAITVAFHETPSYHQRRRV